MIDQIKEPVATTGPGDKQVTAANSTSMITDSSKETIENNLAFLEVGLSIIPLSLDGKKIPTVQLKEYQNRLPTKSEVESWYQSEQGTAVVCGPVSGGLEIMDFDEHAEETFPAWAESVDHILIRLPVVESPDFGYHTYFRCDEGCTGRVIARTPDGKVKIETRGGAYDPVEQRNKTNVCTTVTSPPSVHVLNDRPYVQTAGPCLPEVPRITPAERNELWRAALKFDESAILEKRVQRLKPRPVNREFAGDQPDRLIRLERARKYVGKMEPAISGSGGHNQLFKVAKVLVEKFQLNDEDATDLIEEYNECCQPQWTHTELAYKIRSASR